MLASVERNPTMASGGTDVAQNDSVHALRAGGDREVARMAAFTLQQSAARLGLLSSASTSTEVRAHLSWLSAALVQDVLLLEKTIGNGSSTAHPAPVGTQGCPHGQLVPLVAADPRSACSEVFRRDGDYWAIGHRDAVVRLKDRKGIQYLWCLVSHPGVEFLALDLATRCRNGGALVQAAAAGHDRGLVVLDAASKAAYKRRVTALRGTLEEAEALNDRGTAERARAEIQFIEDELTAAIGLGGRDRTSGSNVERARSTVTKGIKSAIAKISAAHATLGRHFDRTVHTGVFCSYAPAEEERLSWQL
jgi:hypothetical protein